jgi:uncharacterized protein (TIGR02246 family)
MMSIHKIVFIAFTVALGAVPAMANDAHHDDHAAPAAKPAPAAAPAKDAHAALPAAAKKEEAQAPAPAAAPEGATAAKDETPAKPAPRKPKRKKAKPAAEAKHADSAHGDAHGVPVPPTLAPGARVRVKDRAAAADAVAAAQAAPDHAAPAAAAPAEHASHDAPPAHDAATPDAPADAHAAPAATADNHDDHSAPAVPAAIAPTKRSRVKASLPTTSAPAAAADHAHDKPVASPSVQDAHDSHAAHDAPVAHDAPAVHDKPEPVQAAVAPVASIETTALTETCNPPLKSEIAALFDRWNASLRSGDPKKVVANYAPESILLPTVSNRARFTVAEKEDYFMHFLQRRPQGYIDDRIIDVDCNSATDAGLYTFRFADGASVKARYSFSYKKIDGQWLITSHHSSGMPEKPEAPVAHVPAPQPAPKAVESSGPAKGWVRFP